MELAPRLGQSGQSRGSSFRIIVVQEATHADKNLRVAMPQDVRQLRRGTERADRCHQCADPHCREEGSKPEDAVGREQGNAGSLSGADCYQCPRHRSASLIERRVAQRLLRRDDRVVASARGDAPAEYRAYGGRQRVMHLYRMASASAACAPSAPIGRRRRVGRPAPGAAPSGHRAAAWRGFAPASITDEQGSNKPTDALSKSSDSLTTMAGVPRRSNISASTACGSSLSIS